MASNDGVPGLSVEVPRFLCECSPGMHICRGDNTGYCRGYAGGYCRKHAVIGSFSEQVTERSFNLPRFMLM